MLPPTEQSPDLVMTKAAAGAALESRSTWSILPFYDFADLPEDSKDGLAVVVFEQISSQPAAAASWSNVSTFSEKRSARKLA